MSARGVQRLVTNQQQMVKNHRTLQTTFQHQDFQNQPWVLTNLGVFLFSDFLSHLSWVYCRWCFTRLGHKKVNMMKQPPKNWKKTSSNIFFLNFPPRLSANITPKLKKKNHGPNITWRPGGSVRSSCFSPDGEKILAAVRRETGKP